MSKQDSIEVALKKLESIVKKIEKETLPLEEALKLFEEGIKLVRFCKQRLDEAKKKVEVLIKTADGELKTEPFE